MNWSQSYDPFNSPVLSTLVAVLPIAVLLGALASHRIRAHWAAVGGLAVAIFVAIVGIGMPTGLALRAAAFGAAYGLFPLGWIILNTIFLYQLAVDSGTFVTVQRSLASLSSDRRIQLVLVAFSFGAFFEGAAGFGTPVAVTGAFLIGLGFAPLEAAVYSLIANTAPVAFGALGTPLIALQGVTGLDLHELSAMVGKQLPFFSVIVPFWLIAAYVGIKKMVEVWPALATAGLAVAIPQFLVSNYHGPWLVDIIASVVSMGALALLLKYWQPPGHVVVANDASAPKLSRAAVWRAWLPWIILSLLVFAWGTPQVKGWLNTISAPQIRIPGLHELILRTPPVVAVPKAEGAVFLFNWISASGTAILIAGLLSGFLLGLPARHIGKRYVQTVGRIAPSLLTIAAMLALGYVTRYSGTDAILGLAFAHTGSLYPFFGTLLGWLGVALTGSDTSSNVLFGGLQVITAQQVGVDPTLMAAANSSGGVMGKMIDAQSIVVAGTATQTQGQEGTILRRVFWHSLALASLVGLLVLVQANIFVPPSPPR
jgi:lactate permease